MVQQGRPQFFFSKTSLLSIILVGRKQLELIKGRLLINTQQQEN